MRNEVSSLLTKPFLNFSKDEADIFSALFSDILLSIVGKTAARKVSGSCASQLFQLCLGSLEGLGVIFLLVCGHTGSLWLGPKEADIG